MICVCALTSLTWFLGGYATRGGLKEHFSPCFQPRLQMTAAPPPAAWTWPTAWPIWSSGCRCRRMKSSCWRWPWQMCWKGLTSQRSIRQLLPWQQAGDQQALKVNRYLFSAPQSWCTNNNYVFILHFPEQVLNLKSKNEFKQNLWILLIIKRPLIIN